MHALRIHEHMAPAAASHRNQAMHARTCGLPGWPTGAPFMCTRVTSLAPDQWQMELTTLHCRPVCPHDPRKGIDDVMLRERDQRDPSIDQRKAPKPMAPGFRFISSMHFASLSVCFVRTCGLRFSRAVFSSPNFLQNFQNSHHIESLNVSKDTCMEYEM